MPTNIEIKAVLKNRVAAESVAARLSDAGPETIHQEDFFFASDRGRLKLRVFGPDLGELICYERANLAAARGSQYLIARTPDPQILNDILTATLGRSGVVKKTRTLYLIGQTRVHLDEVGGLGDFLELEVVLRPGQNESDGKQIMTKLLSEFGIAREELVAEAYIDLLAQSADD